MEMSLSSADVEAGVGDPTSSTCEKNGVLCGRGESSMYSTTCPGDEDGGGGVVTNSTHRSQDDAIRRQSREWL